MESCVDSLLLIATYEDNSHYGKDHGGVGLLASKFRILVACMLLSQIQERGDL